MGRPYKDRLLYDLHEIRKELADEVAKLKPEEFNYAPEESMKSCKALLQEIGSMEKICLTWVAGQQMLDWDTAVSWSGDDANSIMADLASIRAETLAYIDSATEDSLQAGVPVPDEWKQYMPFESIEPEEMIRWVTRHEYYHLGQLITYRWILGDNPYKRT